jgi:hypothetical protein
MARVLTLRGVDDETAVLLKAEAERRGSSVNSLVLQYVRKGLGIGKLPRARYDDLDGFLGSWSREEAEAFLQSLTDFEVIDDEAWRSPFDRA